VSARLSLGKERRRPRLLRERGIPAGHRCRWLAALVAVASLLSGPAACTGSRGENALTARRAVIRIVGSDTMVNLLQAWAERYRHVEPAVVVQVAGGGSGVGLAGLIDRTLDVAAASREIRIAERERLTAIYGTPPAELTVALDALAIYVHPTNPAERISLDALAEIYGEHGSLLRWSELGIRHPACAAGTIIRVGRQNNSGTYAYFRQVVLGPGREYKLGSIDQSGSKDVVALVSRTPCAVGYSGLAYATAGVKQLKVAARPGGTAVAASKASVVDGSYPLARPLYLYAPAPPATHVKAFLEWVLGMEGQTIVGELGFVPPPGPRLTWSRAIRDH
jgi:phosphate transport system substrate-binding protein